MVRKPGARSQKPAGNPAHPAALLSWLLATGFWLLSFPAYAGLTGTYYQFNDFKGEHVSHVDRVMDFQWSGKAPPAPGARADGFSVQWDGELQIERGGVYGFALQTDGPLARLWIDGHLIIDGWHIKKSREFAGSTELTGGRKHRIRIDYNDSFGPNFLRLLWTPPGGQQSSIPEAALTSLASSWESLRIQFSPAKTQAMEGYVSDSGTAFGDRGDGLTYGWDADLTSSAATSASPAPDPRYGSFIAMNGRRWEIGLPSGMYRVRVVAGGPDSVDAVCNIDVEGRAALRNVTTKFNHWLDVTTRVVVTDGRLTISAAEGSKNASLCFIEIEPTDDSTRLLTWLQLGFSSDNKAERCLPPSLKKFGWRQYVRDGALPEIALGSRRILLSNPFGCLPDEAMQFDQLLVAKGAGLDWIDRDFVASWKPITAAGVEVIAYFGAADPDFTKRAGPNADKNAWFDRFFASIKPALDSGMSIAIDSSVMTPENSPLYEAIERLRAMNVPVYVEPRPAKKFRWATNFPVISVDAFWHMSNPAENTGAIPWAVPTEELTGEIIRFIQSPPAGKNWTQRDWFAPNVRDILAEGHTAAISFQSLEHDGIDPYSLLIPTSATTKP